MALTLITPPAVEPVSISELKEFLRVDQFDTSQDNVLLTLGMAARNWCETFTARRFVQQTWRLYMDFFPGFVDTKVVGSKVSSPFVSGANAILVGIRYAVLLPYPPCQSIVSFAYQNANGSVTNLTTDEYVQDFASNPARLTPLFGQMWPVARVVVNAIEIDYVCGYAVPITVSLSVTGDPTTVLGYTFAATDVGRPITIPGAGGAGCMLNTVIASVTSGVGKLRDPALTETRNATALLVNAPNGNPSHWEMFKAGIKLLVAHWYENRVPDESDVPMSVKAVLYPTRDMRL